MVKSDDDYARALDPRPADDPNIQSLDKGEGEAAKARMADRLAAFTRRGSRRGGAGPHTGL